MLAQRMGKKRIIAETGAGMHGVATATLCARFDLECIVYMGAVDVERQKANVFRMKMLGAKVVPVEFGSKTLKDAMNEALRDWVTNVGSTFYSSAPSPRPTPYPMMVRDFQSIIGRETREQMQEAEGRLPDSLIACIGGGSNAMGLFHPFLYDTDIEIYGVEAAGHGLEFGQHAASIAGGKPGVLHGNRTYLLMNADGQINEAHSISAGLDYPGIGPEHSWLHDVGRVTFLSATDDEALHAFALLSKLEGIIPALEPAHAVAKVLQLAPKKPRDHLMVVNISPAAATRIWRPSRGIWTNGQGHDRDAGRSTPSRLPLRERSRAERAGEGLGAEIELVRRGPSPAACYAHGRPLPRGERRMMTTRIDSRFSALKQQGRPALVTFTVAGDPDYDTALSVLKALPAAGADVIELGMPFTDPMADGPAI